MRTAITELQILNALFHPEEFKQSIQDAYDLVDAAAKFPEYADLLIRKVLNNPEEFNRVVRNTDDLILLKSQFAKHSDALILIVIDDPEKFARLIQDSYDFQEMARLFPQPILRSENRQRALEFVTLIKNLINNPEACRGHITNVDKLIELAKLFPNHAKTLITAALSDGDHLDKIILSGSDLCKIARQFPNHAEEIVTRVLNRAGDLNTVQYSLGDLQNLEPLFPKYIENLYRQAYSNPENHNQLFTNISDLIYLAKKYPDIATNMLAKILASPQEIQRLNYHPLAIIELAKTHPEQTEQLLLIALSLPEKFKQLIRKWLDVKNITDKFTKISESLFINLMSDSESYNLIVSDIHALTNLISIFSTHDLELIDKTLSDPNEFKRLIRYSLDFDPLVESLEKYAHVFPILKSRNRETALNKITLLHDVMLSKEYFSIQINNCGLLCNLAANFPTKSELLLAKSRLLTDLEEFKRLVKDFTDLLLLVEAYPGHREKFIEISQVLNNPEQFKRFMHEQFKRLMHETRNLQSLCRLFPRQADDLVLQNCAAVEDSQRAVRTVTDLTTLNFAILPKYTKFIIERLLVNSEEFCRLIKTPFDLITLAREFPEYADALLNKVISETEEFNRLIKYEIQLRLMALHFPKCYILKAINIPQARERITLINKIVANPEEFKRIIKDSDDLIITAMHFRNHKNALLNQILSNPEEFRRIINSSNDLIKIGRYFTEHTDNLIDSVLANPDEFKRLIVNAHDFRNTAQSFPNRRKELFARLLSNPEEFKRLITNSNELRKLAKKFPSYSEALITTALSQEQYFEGLIKTAEDLFETAQLFLHHSHKIITKEQLRRFIGDFYVLRHTTKHFPNIADILICHVLADPEEFKRLITNERDLKKLAKQFPDYPVLQCANVALETNVFVPIKVKKQAQKNDASELVPIIKLFSDIGLISNELTLEEEITRLKNNIIQGRINYESDFESIETFIRINHIDPPFANICLSLVLEKKDQFQRLVTSTSQLCRLAGAFPQHSEILFERVLFDANEIMRLIRNYRDLELIDEYFPKRAGELICKVFSDHKTFEEFLSYYSLGTGLQLKPESYVTFFANCLNNSKQDFVIFVFSNPSYYYRYIKTANDLLTLVGLAPDFENDIITIILSNPEEFRRLFTNQAHLLAARTIYPKYPIFRSANIATAYQAIAKRNELNHLKNVSRTLLQATRDPNCSLSIFSNEVLIKIASHSTDPNIISTKEAEKEALQVFKKYN